MTQKSRTSHFFVDSKKYETNEAFLTGRQIRAIAGVPRIHHLFLEVEGDKHDKMISDGERFDLNRPEGIMRFYTHDLGI